MLHRLYLTARALPLLLALGVPAVVLTIYLHDYQVCKRLAACVKERLASVEKEQAEQKPGREGWTVALDPVLATLFIRGSFTAQALRR